MSIEINNNNSMVISPNRYAGVSFYSPYFNNATYLTYTFRYSPSNSLFVGYPAPFPNTNILSVDSLVVEFTQPSKDVAFLWGNQFGYYNSGQIYVYEGNNQLVATVPVNVGSYWTNISLNQFSQRIRKLVLVRPPVSDTARGHIYIDNR